MALVAPGPTNVLIPTFDPEATGALQVEFTRNATDFALNRYTQLIPVEESVGHYLRIENQDQARVINSGDYLWPDGNDRPRGEEVDHEFPAYATRRNAYDFRLGMKAVDQAKWDIVASHARFKAQKAMTNRSYQAVTKIMDSTLWNAGNTDTATNLGGATWDAATPTNNAIQKSIRSAAIAINLATAGAVGVNDLIMVVNPDDAAAMAESEELLDYIKAQPAGTTFLQGNDIFETWGLPGKLFGVDVAIEDAVRVTSRKGAADAREYIMGGGLAGSAAAILARPGGLIGVPGAPTFASICIFSFEEMTVERADDIWNRRVVGSVVDDFDVQITSDISGYLITGIRT